MSILTQQQVLEILYDNLNNPHPQVVNSEYIANKLEMSLKDTCQILKVMHKLGMVISDIEGQYSLITQQGINHLTNSKSSHFSTAGL